MLILFISFVTPRPPHAKYRVTFVSRILLHLSGRRRARRIHLVVFLSHSSSFFLFFLFFVSFSHARPSCLFMTRMRNEWSPWCEFIRRSRCTIPCLCEDKTFPAVNKYARLERKVANEYDEGNRGNRRRIRSIIIFNFVISRLRNLMDLKYEDFRKLEKIIRSRSKVVDRD